MTMSAGARRHLVRLQIAAGQTPDGEGGFVDDWDDLQPAEVYASIVPATARELGRYFAGTVLATASVLVTVPYHPGVTANTTRVRFGARVLRVLGFADPEERHIETIMACQELVA